MSESKTTIERISDFTELPIGWRFGGGEPATMAAAEKAIDIVRKAESYGWKTEAWPDAGGGIWLRMVTEEKDFNIFVEAGGGIDIYFD